MAASLTTLQFPSPYLKNHLSHTNKFKLKSPAIPKSYGGFSLSLIVIVICRKGGFDCGTWVLFCSIEVGFVWLGSEDCFLTWDFVWIFPQGVHEVVGLNARIQMGENPIRVRKKRVARAWRPYEKRNGELSYRLGLLRANSQLKSPGILMFKIKQFHLDDIGKCFLISSMLFRLLKNELGVFGCAILKLECDYVIPNIIWIRLRKGNRKRKSIWKIESLTFESNHLLTESQNWHELLKLLVN